MTPMKFVQEKEMIERTVDWKELSTSHESEASMQSLQCMVSKAKGKDIRQSTDDVGLS